MEESLAKLHAKFDTFDAQLAKIDSLEQTISKLVQDNNTFREEIRKKDEIIEQLSDKVNRLDQSLRSNSVRVHGLPVNPNTPAHEVPNIVYREIILPIFDAAKRNGDLPPNAEPVLHFTLVSAFSIPTKKNAGSSPVVVKFYSEFIRGLVFKHKRAALPTTTDLSSNKVKPKYSIYEDLTQANHTLLRTFSDDPRVKSAWTFGGQIRFKTHHDDTVYKVSRNSDTYDTLVSKTQGPHHANS
jgi:hypothetical protein